LYGLVAEQRGLLHSWSSGGAEKARKISMTPIEHMWLKVWLKSIYPTRQGAQHASREARRVQGAPSLLPLEHSALLLRPVLDILLFSVFLLVSNDTLTCINIFNRFRPFPLVQCRRDEQASLFAG
jgi:hypothetical protein